MNGIHDTCTDLDTFAAIEERQPAPVFIMQKQAPGRDHLEKVRRFYDEMNSRQLIAEAEILKTATSKGSAECTEHYQQAV